MANFPFVDKITDFIATRRGEDKFGRGNPLGLTETKDAMAFGASGSAMSAGMFISDTYTRAASLALTRYKGTNIDWKREAGDLTMSSLVATGINWLATQLDEPVFTIVEKDSNGNEKVIEEHPASILWETPNDFYDQSTMLSGLAISDTIKGDTYFVKIRNIFGEVIQMWYVPHWMMRPQWPPDNPSVFIHNYVYNLGGRLVEYPIEDIIHFRNQINLADMGRTGTSPVDSVMREICSDEEWSNFNALIATNCGIPPVLITPDTGTETLEPEERERLKQEYMRRTTGDQRGQPLVSSQGMKVEKLSFKPKDLEIGQIRRINEERFSAVFGTPAAVLGLGAGLDKSTYNNMQTAERAAWDRVLLPKLKRYQRLLRKSLLAEFYPKRKVPSNVFVRFNVDEVRALQEDRNTEHERHRKNFLAGGMTLYEFQEAIGRTPDKNAKFYLFAKNYVPTTSEAAMKLAKEGPVVAPAIQPAGALDDNGQPIQQPGVPEPKGKPNGKAVN